MAVYFAQEGTCGHVKVGYAKDEAGARKRVASFQTGNSAPLRILRILDGGREREQLLHRTFKKRGLHIRGEWFACLGLVAEVAFDPVAEWAWQDERHIDKGTWRELL